MGSFICGVLLGFMLAASVASGILCLRWDKHTELNLNQIQLGFSDDVGVMIMRIAIILLILLFTYIIRVQMLV